MDRLRLGHEMLRNEGQTASRLWRGIWPLAPAMAAGVALALSGGTPSAHAAPSAQSSQPVLVQEYINYVTTNFLAAEARYRREPNNAEAAWQLGRAIFDRADYATNSVERAQLAEEGIAACEVAVSHEPKLAAAHYYLGMDLGQLARTKSVGALKIVKRMEKEFLAARDLDAKFDYAGPDRNLGLLYREAPPVLSIGSRKDARQHLQRAVELVPQYPENQLNLIEAFIMWSELAEAQRSSKALDAIWAAASTNLVGVAWSGSWKDWEDRRAKAKKTLYDSGTGGSGTNDKR